ncbi:MAG: uncharacterized protein QOI80_1888 [Solirubrobacteraceae bacterium]|jgi:hypothetical protein|nr:uncharacterized protein [Solirubrobacteraceae bacterium]
MPVAEALNRPELDAYVRRIVDRFPLHRAFLGGARVDDARGLGAQRERGPEYVLVLVSEHFDGVPWLERVYQAASLWDAYTMGGRAEVHCYTPAEYARKVRTLPAVRRAARSGIELA